MNGNGSNTIKLSWGQITWALAVLVVLIGGWFRIEYRLTQLEQTVKDGIYSKSAIDGMRREADTEHGRLQQRIEDLKRRRREP